MSTPSRTPAHSYGLRSRTPKTIEPKKKVGFKTESDEVDIPNEIDKESSIDSDSDDGNQNNGNLYPTEKLNAMKKMQGKESVTKTKRVRHNAGSPDGNTSTQDKKPYAKSSFKYLRYLLYLTSLIVIGFALVSGKVISPLSEYFKLNSTEQVVKPDVLQLFYQELKPFETKYDAVIPLNGMKVIKTAVENGIRPRGERQPAVILIVGWSGQNHVASCLAQDLVALIARSYGESTPSPLEGTRTGSKQIVSAFENVFEGGNHVMLVKNVDSIPADSVMALHGFTDHENARFPQAIIVLTAFTSNKIELNKNAKLKDMDVIASRLFDVAWKNSLEDEQRAALMVRLTPSVVTVMHDKNSNKKYC